jgi:hypothetical protein
MSENIPHSLGGFRGAFESEHGRKPTEQEIWNAAICSWRDLTKQKSDVAKERVVDLLLEYAGDNGYSHIDYADTMRHAAALLQSTALPVGELTDEQILDAEKWAAIGATGRDDLTIRTARAVLAAARSQSVREPLTVEAYTAIAHRTASKYAHRSDLSFVAYTFLPHTLDDFVRKIEAAHGITQGGNV